MNGSYKNKASGPGLSNVQGISKHDYQIDDNPVDEKNVVVLGKGDHLGDTVDLVGTKYMPTKMVELKWEQKFRKMNKKFENLQCKLEQQIKALQDKID